MGPGTHFYFVDACRNPVSAKDVNPGGLGWRRPTSQLGQPGVFTLFAAERGNVAAVRSGFAPAVVDGLAGRGRAKRREGVEMWVSFDSLRTYLETALAQRVDPEPGPGPGHILRIDPIPSYRCTVQVKNAGNADQFTATLMNAYGVQVGQSVQFQGGETALQAQPDDYFVQVTHKQYALNPSTPAKADLYDDCTVEFEKTAQPVAPAAPYVPAPPVPVSVTAPPSAMLEITDLKTGEVVSQPQTIFAGSFAGTLWPGAYQVRVLESEWSAVRDFRFVVDPSPSPAGTGHAAAMSSLHTGLHIDAASRDPSPLRDALLNVIPGQHDSVHADFSEQLGPLANQDLGLWLSIVGASRILGAQEFSKLDNLPLASFADVKVGAAPIYLLAGAEGSSEVAAAAVRRPGAIGPQLAPLHPVPGVPGLSELRADTVFGMHLVYFRFGDAATSATVAYSLPNRATLFVVATNAAGETRIHQFILPLARLKQYLSPAEQGLQPANLLEAIRFATLAQTQASRLRSPAPPPAGDPQKDPQLTKDNDSWNGLLYGKWLDPITALLAAYQLAGNPKTETALGFLKQTLANLRAWFPTLPDTEVVARIAGLPHAEPQSSPLFLAGLQALENPEALTPLPMGKLNYAGPWITWLGVQ